MVMALAVLKHTASSTRLYALAGLKWPPSLYSSVNPVHLLGKYAPKYDFWIASLSWNGTFGVMSTQMSDVEKRAFVTFSISSDLCLGHSRRVTANLFGHSHCFRMAIVVRRPIGWIVVCPQAAPSARPKCLLVIESEMQPSIWSGAANSEAGKETLYNATPMTDYGWLKGKPQHILWQTSLPIWAWNDCDLIPKG